MSNSAGGKVYEEGKSSFYEGIPRYKCRYTEEAFINWWQVGWDVASKEHELFVKNQQLKSANDSMREELEGISENLSVMRGIQNDIKQEILVLLSRLDSKEEALEEISEHVNGAFYYIENSGALSFRREKMKSHLQDIRVLIKKAEKSVSPEVKKLKPKETEKS